MDLIHPSTTARFYAKQVIEAILEHPDLKIWNTVPTGDFWPEDAETVLDILFKETDDG